MRDYVRWGSLFAAFAGFVFVFKRSRRPKRIDPDSLGPVSQQWFMDRRYDL